MRVVIWNGVPWNAGAWDGVFFRPARLPTTPSPVVPRFREITRRVGVQNETVMQQTVAVNQEANVFFEYNGVSGLDTINPDEIHCPGFKLGKDAV